MWLNEAAIVSDQSSYQNYDHLYPLKDTQDSLIGSLVWHRQPQVTPIVTASYSKKLFQLDLSLIATAVLRVDLLLIQHPINILKDKTLMFDS